MTGRESCEVLGKERSESSAMGGRRNWGFCREREREYQTEKGRERDSAGHSPLLASPVPAAALDPIPHHSSLLQLFSVPPALSPSLLFQPLVVIFGTRWIGGDARGGR